MAQRLKVYIILAEDPSLIPSPIQQHTTRSRAPAAPNSHREREGRGRERERESMCEHLVDSVNHRSGQKEGIYAKYVTFPHQHFPKNSAQQYFYIVLDILSNLKKTYGMLEDMWLLNVSTAPFYRRNLSHLWIWVSVSGKGCSRSIYTIEGQQSRHRQTDRQTDGDKTQGYKEKHGACKSINKVCGRG